MPTEEEPVDLKYKLPETMYSKKKSITLIVIS